MHLVDIHCNIEKEGSSRSSSRHKRMDSIENQQTTTYVDRKCLLLFLVNKLKSLLCGKNNDIPEVNLLHEFPTYDVTLPEMHFSPRRIIEYMIDTHECAKLKMEARSEFLKIVIYNYYHSSTIKQFQFSNNMSLTADLFTICYFYHAIVTREYYALKVMKDIFDIMINKYKIKNKSDMKLTKDFNERTITVSRITYSFPSISFPFFGHQPDISKSVPLHPIFTMFPGLSLNKILCCPLVPFIMPKLNSNNNIFIPIAFLMAINIKNNQILKNSLKYPNYPDMSLAVMYQRILKLHASTTFPTSLKLQLCLKWGFVEMKQKDYKYADYFIKYQQKALDIILKLKSEDPDLHKIVSEIFVDV